MLLFWAMEQEKRCYRTRGRNRLFWLPQMRCWTVVRVFYVIGTGTRVEWSSVHSSICWSIDIYSSLSTCEVTPNSCELLQIKNCELENKLLWNATSLCTQSYSMIQCSVAGSAMIQESQVLDRYQTRALLWNDLSKLAFSQFCHSSLFSSCSLFTFWDVCSHFFKYLNFPPCLADYFLQPEIKEFENVLPQVYFGVSSNLPFQSTSIELSKSNGVHFTVGLDTKGQKYHL